jgi:hypothetical protein
MAAQGLIDCLAENFLLLNCSTAMKNVVRSRGFEHQELDKESAQFSTPAKGDISPKSIDQRKEKRAKK